MNNDANTLEELFALSEAKRIVVEGLLERAEIRERGLLEKIACLEKWLREFSKEAKP